MKIKKCYILGYHKFDDYTSIKAMLSKKCNFVRKLGYLPVSINPEDYFSYNKQLEILSRCDCVYIRKIKYNDKSFINDLLLYAISVGKSIISKYGERGIEENKGDYQERIRQH